jgi:hypothetical protein
MLTQDLPFIAVGMLLIGCSDSAGQVSSTPGGKSKISWHSKCGWKAEEYFSDPQVVALCKAIEANDLKEIDRLVAAGLM